MIDSFPAAVYQPQIIWNQSGRIASESWCQMVTGVTKGWGRFTVNLSHSLEMHPSLIALQLLSVWTNRHGNRVMWRMGILRQRFLFQRMTALCFPLFPGPVGWRRRPSTKPTRSSCGGSTRSMVSTAHKLHIWHLLWWYSCFNSCWRITFIFSVPRNALANSVNSENKAMFVYSWKVWGFFLLDRENLRNIYQSKGSSLGIVF